jgi:xylulokinase
MSYLIGIDVGTGELKTVLFDEQGKTVVTATQGYPLSIPQPSWAEQDPDHWWKATLSTIQEILQKSKVNPKEIKGIGLSGQMHGSVFLDKHGKVIRPCILWCDGRTESQCAYITRKVGKAKLHKYTSNRMLTGFTAPKLVWLQQNEPANFEKVHVLLLPKDYIRYKLTGEFACDISDAAGSLLFNVKNGKWSKEVLSALNISDSWLPPVFGSSEVCGRITSEVSRQTGLKTGTPVVAGGADNTCGAIGTGVVKEGRVLSSIGTSGVIFAPTRQIKVDPKERVHTFNHSVPNQWYLMGCMLSAGLSLRWFRDTFGQEEKSQVSSLRSKVDPYQLLIEEAGQVAPGSEGLIFLPYLMGERSPHGDVNARGVFFGMSLRHAKPHFIRAILEGVTFGMRDSLEIISGLKIPVQEIRATGGGARSGFWCQLQANIYGREVVTVNSTEGPALGAAILAGVGTGIYSSISEACDRVVKVVHRYEPDNVIHQQYNAHYQLFHSLYPLLKKSFLQNNRLTLSRFQV